MSSLQLAAWRRSMGRRIARLRASRARLLALLLLAGCAGGDAITEITAAPLAAPAPPETWLPPDHPAYAAQAAWGLPAPCPTVDVVELPGAELQAACNSEAELAARPAGMHTDGCEIPAQRCTIYISADLTAERRAVVMVHEYGHVLAPGRGHIPVGEDCPEDAPGAALMCRLGPESGNPEPTAADFDFVLQ